jgi:hypothetical protein
MWMTRVSDWLHTWQSPTTRFDPQRFIVANHTHVGNPLPTHTEEVGIALSFPLEVGGHCCCLTFCRSMDAPVGVDGLWRDLEAVRLRMREHSRNTETVLFAMVLHYQQYLSAKNGVPPPEAGGVDVGEQHDEEPASKKAKAVDGRE